MKTVVFFSEQELEVFERKVLRRIYGLIRDNGQWRKLYNHEIKQIYQSPPITEYLRVQRLLWIGQVRRMNESDRVPKKCLLGQPDGTRNQTAWSSKSVSAVHGAHQQDPQKYKITGWEREAADTSKWKQIVWEAYNRQIWRPNGLAYMAWPGLYVCIRNIIESGINGISRISSTWKSTEITEHRGRGKKVQMKFETKRDTERLSWQIMTARDRKMTNFKILSRCHFLVTAVFLCLSQSLNFISVSNFICTFLPVASSTRILVLETLKVILTIDFFLNVIE